MECLGENTVADLVGAAVSATERAAIEAHTSTCDPCRRLVAELIRRSGDRSAVVPVPSTPREFVAGTRVGRYVVREVIGAGAMGAVFAAFDPELDRAIALKVLHPGTGAQRDRVLREARAIAKLSHPNVVAAYDVEDLDGDLVLAMELVEGANLREWMREPRSIDAIVGVFQQVAAGLAAAHAVGLVHRDVKPANIVVGRDGRVRVVDFGLATSDGSTDLVGTPAYMAPELFEGGEANARSDQFALCVALYEAIEGARPFVVNFVDEVARGASSRTANTSLRAAIARGLAVDPEQRFESLDALAAALAPPRRRRAWGRRAWIAVGAGAAIVATIAVVGVDRSSGPSPCSDAAASVRELWTAERANAVHARFAADRAPYAEAAWRSVDAGMRAFVDRWTAGRQQACIATRVRGAQSDQILTLREACLDRALGEALAVAKLLAIADHATVEHAAGAVDALSSLTECANTTALLSPVPAPSARYAPAISVIANRLAYGRALRDAAHWTEAREVATSTLADARTVAHDPTLAAAQFFLGEVHGGAGDAKRAEVALREAYATAERGHDDMLAARAATELVFVVGEQQGRINDGLEWSFHAETLLARVGGDDELNARLANNLASVRYSQNQYTAARELYQKALDLRISLNGAQSRAAGRAMFNLGRALMAEGDLKAGRSKIEQSIAILEASIGPDHPDIAVALTGLASMQLNSGASAAALATLDRALARPARSLAAAHPIVGRIVLMRGHTLAALGRPSEATIDFTRALAIFDVPNSDPRLLSDALSGRGDAELAQGKLEDAAKTYRQSLAIVTAAFGPESEDAAIGLENLARLDAKAKRHTAALAGFRAALAIREKVNPPDYFEKAFSLAGIGDAQTALGDPAGAVGPLRRAIKLFSSFGGAPVDLAKMRFSLAIALWASNGDRTEARALASLAEGSLADDPDSLAAVRAWKAAHR